MSPPAPSSRPTASTLPIADCAPSPYFRSSQLASQTPTSDIGALVMNIQAPRRACTVPSRRWRMPPAVLKIAPCAMSVPIATVGLNPKTITSSGVISEPPPMPVSPTSAPTRAPLRISCHHMDASPGSVPYILYKSSQ